MKWASTLDRTTKSRELWNKAKFITKRRLKTNIHPDPVGEAARVTTTYTQNSKLSEADPATQRAVHRLQASMEQPLQQALGQRHWTDEPFTIHELEEALASRGNTSPGEDGIPYKLMSATPHCLKLQLLSLYNLSWSTGVIPAAWKRSTFIPIPKPGKKDEFRPITLLSCLHKTMEVMVLRRVQAHESTISQLSFGFRAGYSTYDALCNLTNFISRSHSVSLKTRPVAVFLDISKAFDRLPPAAVVKGLIEGGFSGSILRWLNNSLQDRWTAVRHQGTTAEHQNIDLGTPHGSVLSPTLFNIAMEHVLRTRLPKGVFIQSYADDLVLFTKATNGNLLNLQAALSAVNIRAKEIGLVFAPQKTHAMAFGRQPPPLTKLKIDSATIDWVKEYKYLGVYLDPVLNYNRHVKYTIDRLQSRINALKFLACAPDGPCTQALRTIYVACIQTVIDYGAPAMLRISKAAIKKLEAVEMAGLRVVAGVHRSTNMESLRLELDLLPYGVRRNIRSLCYLTSILAKGRSHPLHEVLTLDRVKHVKLHQHIHTWSMEAGRLLQSHPADYGNLPTPHFPTDLPWERPRFTSRISKPFKTKKEQSQADLLAFYSKEVTDLNQDRLPYFTDGSLQGGLATGACFTPEHSTFTAKLAKPATILQGELTGIGLALRHASIHHPLSRIVIHTDSLSAIQVLANRLPNDDKHLVSAIYDFTDSLEWPVILNWVPSHVGIKGNEEADLAADEAFDYPDMIILNNKPSFAQIKAHIKNVQRCRWLFQIDGLSDHSKSLWITYTLITREGSLSNTGQCRRAIEHQIHSLRTNSRPLWKDTFEDENRNRCHHCHQRYTVSHTAHYLGECEAHIEDLQQLYLALSHDQRDTDDDLEELAVRILAAESRRNYTYLGPALTRLPFRPNRLVRGSAYKRTTRHPPRDP